MTSVQRYLPGFEPDESHVQGLTYIQKMYAAIIAGALTGLISVVLEITAANSTIFLGLFALISYFSIAHWMEHKKERNRIIEIFNKEMYQKGE